MTTPLRGELAGFTAQLPFTLDDFTYSSTPIPEPSTFVLLAIGSTALVGWRRR